MFSVRLYIAYSQLSDPRYACSFTGSTQYEELDPKLPAGERSRFIALL